MGAKPFGFESVSRLEPTEWVLAMLATPDRWREEPIVKVTHAGLREAAGLPQDKDRYTFNELVNHEGFLDAVQEVHAKLRQDESIDPVERELADLYDTLSVMSGIMSGEALRIIPHSDDPKATWFTIADLTKPEVPQVQRVRALLTALVSAYAAGDRPGVQTASAGLASRLASIAPAVYPSEKDLAREVHYNRHQALPDRLDPLPPRLPRPDRELPPRLEGLRPGGDGPRRRRLPLQRLRDAAANDDLRSPAGHQHVRDRRLRGLGRGALRPRSSRGSTRSGTSPPPPPASAPSASSSPTTSRSSTGPSPPSCRCSATTCGSRSTCSRSCSATPPSPWPWAWAT